jgi:predicted nucleic acid-binding protein
VPELVKYELGDVLICGKNLNSKQAEVVLSQFYKIPLSFIEDSRPLAIKTADIAQDLNITYYDAAFIALAEQLKATLVTENMKHQGKTKDIRVIAIKDYT